MFTTMARIRLWEGMFFASRAGSVAVSGYPRKITTRRSYNNFQRVETPFSCVQKRSLFEAQGNRPEHFLMAEASPFSVSSSEFVEFSCLCPVQKFDDIMNEVTWEYRVGGREDADEAVAIIPDVNETTNGSFLVARGLINAGYRVLIVSIPPYLSVVPFMTGFDLLTASKMISKVHLVGIGFGGYLCCQIANFHQLSAEVGSITIISSCMNPAKIFKSAIGAFPSLTGKSDLTKELNKDKVPEPLRPACAFVASEIESLPSALVGARLKFRGKAPLAPVPKIDAERVMVIQPSDWAFKMEDAARPHRAIPGCRYEKIESGGNVPHLANADKVVELLKDHLGKWHAPLPKEEEEEDDNEEEEF